MRVFVAGATGAIGKRLVPMLVANGHEVVAMTRSAQKTDPLRAAGATPVVADGLDRRAVVDAVVNAKPDVVIHQLTALTGFRSLKHWDREWEQTDRLRTQGPTTSWRAPAPPARGRSWRKATRGGPMRPRAGRSRPSRTRSTPTHHRRCVAPWTPSGTWSSRCSARPTWTALPCGTGTCTGRGPRSHWAGTLWRRSAAGSCPSLPTAPARGRSSTSRTRPRPRWPPSSAARQGCTTSSTTSPHRSRSGCPSWPRRSARNRPGASRRGLPVRSSARRASR